MEDGSSIAFASSIGLSCGYGGWRMEAFFLDVCSSALLLIFFTSKVKKVPVVPFLHCCRSGLWRIVFDLVFNPPSSSIRQVSK